MGIEYVICFCVLKIVKFYNLLEIRNIKVYHKVNTFEPSLNSIVQYFFQICALAGLRYISTIVNKFQQVQGYNITNMSILLPNYVWITYIYCFNLVKIMLIYLC